MFMGWLFTGTDAIKTTVRPLRNNVHHPAAVITILWSTIIRERWYRKAQTFPVTIKPD
jgi:hypothetical protein